MLFFFISVTLSRARTVEREARQRFVFLVLGQSELKSRGGKQEKKKTRGADVTAEMLGGGQTGGDLRLIFYYYFFFPRREERRGARSAQIRHGVRARVKQS